MWAHECEQWACEHELWTCEFNFVNNIKYFIECSCHVDIIILMICEIPIAIRKILLPHGKYSYDAAMIIQHIIDFVT
jgi:hypothetical protein